MRSPRAWILLLPVLAALGGCDDPPKTGPASPSTGSTGSTASAAPTAAPADTVARPKTMPELQVDSEGPYLGMTRVDLSAAGSAEKLATAIQALPINGQPVTLIVAKKAKTSYVAAVVTALGKAGAPKVTIKTEGRDDLPKQIALTPETRVTTAPGCSITTMVLKDLATAIWSVKGGTAKLQRKGLAGPDLTRTGDELKKQIAGCDSTMAFFSGDDAVSWELAFNLAGTVVNADEKKKVDTLVLLHEAPVAGRPVAAGKLP